MTGLPKRLAQTCFNAADRFLGLGFRAFETTGSMPVWDLVVVRVAYGLLVLGNTLERAAGLASTNSSAPSRTRPSASRPPPCSRTR
jgi:hypothetical protein